MKTRAEVRARLVELLNGSDGLYAQVQSELGIGGDVAPWEIERIENAEAEFVDVISNWLSFGLEMGDDDR